MKKKTIGGFLFFLFLVCSTIWILQFRGTQSLRTAEGAIFGTTYHIKYEASEPLDSVILAELNKVDASLSVFNQQSTISKINAGQTLRTDAMLFEVLTKAKAVSDATEGAFDVTVMPLVNAWGFGFKQGIFPTDQQVDSLKQLVGFHRIKLTPDSLLVKADPRTMIDCGAIAKGYGVDCVARVLREHGVMNYMIEIGGEVVTKGKNPEGHAWKIGISQPIDASPSMASKVQTVLSLENAAMATSGNYRNFYERNGKKYAHTIDPRTGRPVQHSLLSATVMAPDCATADAYATAFMVMGMEKAEEVLKKHKELHVYFIYADNKGIMKTYTNIPAKLLE